MYVVVLHLEHVGFHTVQSGRQCVGVAREDIFEALAQLQNKFAYFAGEIGRYVHALYVDRLLDIVVGVLVEVLLDYTFREVTCLVGLHMNEPTRHVTSRNV